MKTKGWISFLTLASICWVACNNDNDNNNSTTLDQTDKDFAINAEMANRTEVNFGELAATQGADSSVRAFGQQMASEHTTAINELKQITSGYSGITWSTTLDAHHDSVRQQLTQLSGAAFDSVYIASQVADHQKALTLFQNEAQNGNMQEIKYYASKYVGHIQEHLDRATTIRTELMNNRTSSPSGRQ
jgi:putative membrane protein